MVACSNWGLSFQTKNAPPKADFDAAYLKQYDAMYIGGAEKKTVYLTFDAGFENGQTPGILDTLKKNAVPAAFFLVGNYLEREPALVKRMADEGHIVGNHTFHHPDMSAVVTMDGFRKELEAMEVKFKEVTGRELPKFYRPPMGKFSEQNLKFAKELGYRTVFWSLAYVDWKRDEQPSPAEAMEKLTSRIHPGAVILLHSTSQTNADILDGFIGKLREDGYEFGTLEQLFA